VIGWFQISVTILNAVHCAIEVLQIQNTDKSLNILKRLICSFYCKVQKLIKL